MRKTCEILFFLSVMTTTLYADEKNPYLPDTSVTQFAGYIGFISGGAGYEFFDDILIIELLYGYVPASMGGIDIHMLSEKNTVSPIKISLGSGYTIYPLTLGFFINYTFGSQYKVIWPSTYPEWYYRPTAVYTGDSIGIRIKKNTNGQVIKAWELYADIVTMSEYLYEYVTNDRIKLEYILSIDLGIRIHF